MSQSSAACQQFITWGAASGRKPVAHLIQSRPTLFGQDRTLALTKKAGWNTPARPEVGTTATLLLGTAAKHASRRGNGVLRHLRDQPGRYEFFTGLRHEMTDAL